MKLRNLLLVAGLAGALVAVGMGAAHVQDWFSQTFSTLTDGTAFTGQGAVGGTWDAIPGGVATVSTAGGRKCIRIDTFNTSDNAIRFNASETLASDVRVDFAISTDPVEVFPELEGDSNVGALCLLSTNQVGVREFGALTQAGWTNLYGRGLMQRKHEWLDCRAEFSYVTNAAGRVLSATVAYYSRLGDGGEYVALTDVNGVSSFALATDAVCRVAFRGTGHVGDLAGFGVAQDAARVDTWTGDVDDDWDTGGNWSWGQKPRDGDVALINGSHDIRRTIGAEAVQIATYGEQTRLVSLSDKTLRVLSGDVEIYRGVDSEAWGTVLVDAGATLRAYGTFDGIDLAYGARLALDLSDELVVTTLPLMLDGVTLWILDDPDDATEATRLVHAPYGSGGEPAALVYGTAQAARTEWFVAWHGCLDGSARLWLVNGGYLGDVAVWNEGAVGLLSFTGNWGDIKPSSSVAAWIGRGTAHHSATEKEGPFAFARQFDIGAGTNETGEVVASSGSIAGGAVVVGANAGTGALDLVGGTMRTTDHLWNSALTVGANSGAAGEVKVGVASSVASGLFAENGGGISVGAGGLATMEIGAGKRYQGTVTAEGPVAVGYQGQLRVTGGCLVGRDAFYVGRADRDGVYDVEMSVSGGVVSNRSETSGAFWVGSYGGIGSKASLNITGGTVYSTNRFVCGGYRSASVEVSGGALIAPEIRVGHDLTDEDETASFALVSGRVETAGFSVGSNGVRTIVLAGGEILAMAENADFFKDLSSVALAGDVTFANEDAVAITSALTGGGGLTKAGGGSLMVSGYAAWAGATRVEAGTLDMDGGMIMGELEIAEGAAVEHAKYDDLNAFPLAQIAWKNDGTASSKSYLRIAFANRETQTGEATATDADGVVKGAVRRTDDGLEGWTALGWTTLLNPDGSPVAVDDSELRMFFDFRPGTKPYVVYEIGVGETFQRLVSTDGLTVFPVSGELLSVQQFTGVTMTSGYEMYVTTGSAYYWIGPDGGSWNDGANWSLVAGGAAADACPTDEATAFIDRPVTIRLADGDVANSLVLNAKVRLVGETLSLGSQIVGNGRLILAGAKIAANASTLGVNVTVEIESDTENELTGDVSLHGTILGAGRLATSAKIYGNTAEFAGVLTLLDGGICSPEATDNARSSWTLSGTFPFAIGDCEYTFGALNGSFAPQATGATRITLTVGARDEDCQLDGEWSAGSESGLDWVAATASMNYSVTNSAFVRLCGGGQIVLARNDALADVVSFVEKGGTLALASGVDVDVSGAIRDSTAPVAFDDGGADHTWAAAFAASNVGGFVKRGTGTLTWAQVPEAILDVSIEAGTLVVPFGTSIGRVTIATGAHLVVDLTNAQAARVVFSATSANRELKTPYLQFVNTPAGYDYNIVRGDNNSVVVVNGSLNYEWASDVPEGDWSTLSNWRVDGEIPERLPQTNDTVTFSAACTTVRLDVAAYAMKVKANGDLHLFDGRLTTLLSCDLVKNEMELSEAEVVCGGALTVGSVYGSGTISVGGGTLAVAPAKGETHAFVGVLNVTNLVKNGKGTFNYEPRAAFDGTIHVGRGTFVWNCLGAMTNQPNVRVTMTAGSDPDTTLGLCGATVLVGSFKGSGFVQNGVLQTADGVVTQSGGRLVIPLVANTTYYASRSDEKLEIASDDGDDLGVFVKIVIPRTWYAAGASGRRAVYCKSKNIDWGTVRPIDEGDGWWSIPGGGFSVRLR